MWNDKKCDDLIFGSFSIFLSSSISLIFIYVFKFQEPFFFLGTPNSECFSLYMSDFKAEKTQVIS